MKEEIRSLESLGFPGYFVSSEGNVISENKGRKRLLKRCRHRHGGSHAWLVCLRTAKRRFTQKSIALLVLLAFRGEPGRKFTTGSAVFLDGNKDNCRLENLEWRTATKEPCVKVTLDAEYIWKLEQMAALRKVTINKVAQEILVDFLSKEK